nr:hypothetical protein [Tanacetum cinerariifolium]
MVQKPVLKNVEKGTVQREVRPVWNNAMRTNHQIFSNSRKNFAPKSVLTKSRIVPISTARQISSRVAAPVSAAMPINTAASKPLVKVAKPRQNALQKSHSLSRRPFYQQTALQNRNLNNNVNTAKANYVNTAMGNKVPSVVRKQEINDVKSSGDPQDALKDQVYFENGCSRHMTGNISHLTDFKEHDEVMLPLEEEIKVMVQKPVLKNVEKGTVQREVRPVWNNAMRTNHQIFSNSRKNFAPKSVLTKSRIVPISTARQSSSRVAAPVSAAMPINTAASKPLVKVAKPRQNALQKSHSLSRRPFYQQTALQNRNLNNNVNTAKANYVNTAMGNKVPSVVRKQEINDVKSSVC